MCFLEMLSLIQATMETMQSTTACQLFYINSLTKAKILQDLLMTPD